MAHSGWNTAMYSLIIYVLKSERQYSQKENENYDNNSTTAWRVKLRRLPPRLLNVMLSPKFLFIAAGTNRDVYYAG